MAEEDEEKTGFHMEEGVYCFTHMPKELKNSAATLQRMMEKEIKQVANIGHPKRMRRSNAMSTAKKRDNKFRVIGRKGRNPDTCFLWPRDYTGKEAIEEGSGVGIILASLEEKMYSYATRLKFKASNYAMDCEAQLAGLAASANQGMKDLHVFIDSLTLVAQVEGNHTSTTEHERRYKEEIMDATDVSVGIKTRTSVEETSSCKKGKATSNAPGTKPNCNHEASGSN
ncbi:reverse transcriptase domain-containing protein [Tanacetum coccineum]